jgi:predicted CopG family antitoxin
MHKTNNRHTITIDDKTFQLLKGKGNFGETYSEVISRLIEGGGVNHDSNG